MAAQNIAIVHGMLGVLHRVFYGLNVSFSNALLLALVAARRSSPQAPKLQKPMRKVVMVSPLHIVSCWLALYPAVSNRRLS
jgi:hypothetical protein